MSLKTKKHPFVLPFNNFINQLSLAFQFSPEMSSVLLLPNFNLLKQILNHSLAIFIIISKWILLLRKLSFREMWSEALRLLAFLSAESGAEGTVVRATLLPSID